MHALGAYMPNWNHTLASRVMAHRSELFPNGNHITNSVDSYYIVGTGEETSYQTCGIPDNLMHPTEFSMFSLYKNNLGDGTVTQYSATIGNTTPSNKTYYKHGSSTMSASHVGMITGESNDYSTLNFIVVLINGTVNQVPESYLNSQYGIYR